MKIVRFLLALIFYFTGISYLRAKLLARKEPLVRMTLIHHIKDESAFERMISLMARKYNPISLEDFSAKRFEKDKINLIFTMDDGYESWFKKGLPILEKYNVPAVFFVSSGFIECAGNENMVTQFCKDNLKLSWVSKPLNREMLVECAKHPLITIGGHTRMHPFLSLVSEDEALKEMREDKLVLESIIGDKVPVFAYPFGNTNNNVSRIAKEVGYDFAMTTINNFYNRRMNPYLLPRSNHGTVSSLVLRMWILGAYDMVDKIESYLKKLFRMSGR